MRISPRAAADKLRYKEKTMVILSGTTEFHIEEPTAMAIGKFDGVHLGHRKILETIQKKKEDGLRSAVFTFAPSPAVFLGKGDIKELMTPEEKRNVLQEIGIDYLVEFPLTKQTAATDPASFVREIMAGQMHARFVAAGRDLSFGDRGAGDFTLLHGLEKECAFTSEEVEKVKIEGMEVSSTLIRQYVEKGQMEMAAAMLGEPYRVEGIICHGNEIGRTLGIPTINQIPAKTKLLPPFGVYYSTVEIEGKKYGGMTNIGQKPTISRQDHPGQPAITVETYLYDFDGDVYGKRAVTRLLTYRRPEMKFSGLEELQRTMEADVEAGREYMMRGAVQKRRLKW